MTTAEIDWRDLASYLVLLLPASEAELHALTQADRDTLIGLLATLQERASAASTTAQAA